MKTLLENDLVLHYGKRKGSVIISPRIVNGESVLFDPVACRQCVNFFRIHCPHETFCLNCNNDVQVVDHESVINKLQLPGDKCDFLMYDTEKIALLDLTCTMEHYLGMHQVDGAAREGKRMKSRNQLAKSIERLCAVPSIATHIAGYQYRAAILGYRVKDEDLFRAVPVQFTKSEQVWLELARQREKRHLITPMPNGFTFKMVRYPQAYQW